MFLICGEALFDVFIDPIENGSAGNSTTALSAVAGGSPYNVAIGLARLGRKAALCTEISPDQLGKRLESALADEGVDLSFIRRAEGATPLALVDVDENGLPHYGFHGLRQMCLHPVAATLQAQRARITGIHVGSFPIVSEKSAEKLLTLVADAGERIVSLDPNIRLAVEPDVALWRTQLDRFRVHAHLIKTSVEDLEAIYGSDVDAEAIARSWLGEKTKLIVLTRGERGGVLFAGNGERIEIEATPTTVVDTVGAGDTYQAALLCWLDEAGYPTPAGLSALSTAQLAEMARFAGLAASITCSRRGPDLPRRAELHAHSAASVVKSGSGQPAG
ncbi:carbohydrate kinase family protein [Xanthomonas campestris]|uniref:carbohydrate kinase family protein n=1 Tax=Xanthomonas campestris TaxID=339 RepID=UPI001E534FCB|nr:carbohydrate kinase [Xanthomonas campestris]MCC5071195.1 carbohydrate kinase [Xanthomonas campestris pv. plantaginis]MEA9605384.1 carbohydrate kinase [Xanthomonas campestris pv. plantaginis]